jgi:hypothetical protein
MTISSQMFITHEPNHQWCAESPSACPARKSADLPQDPASLLHSFLVKMDLAATPDPPHLDGAPCFSLRRSKTQSRTGQLYSPVLVDSLSQLFAMSAPVTFGHFRRCCSSDASTHSGRSRQTTQSSPGATSQRRGSTCPHKPERPLPLSSGPALDICWRHWLLLRRLCASRL